MNKNNLKNIMYGSYETWNLFINKNLNLKIDLSSKIKELFLIRNCLIYNDGKVDLKLLHIMHNVTFYDIMYTMDSLELTAYLEKEDFN